MEQARRTYIYKLTSDRGGAPCAPPGQAGEASLLTLSICKPAIRRTARPGDRLLGLTSHALAASDGYPVEAVIYAAVVEDGLDARDYYGGQPAFRERPDCIYAFHRQLGTIEHTGRTPLHANPAYLSRDLGQYPFYRNGRTLLCREFRYFGREAIAIPARMHELRQLADSLGQGHRVVHSEGLDRELDALFRLLWKQPTRYTAAVVTDEAYDHTPRPRSAGAVGARRSGGCT